MVGSLAFVVHSVVLLLIVVNSTSSISFLTEVYISYFYIYISYSTQKHALLLRQTTSISVKLVLV